MKTLDKNIRYKDFFKRYKKNGNYYYMGKLIINYRRNQKIIVKIDDEDIHRLKRLNWQVDEDSQKYLQVISNIKKGKFFLQNYIMYLNDNELVIHKNSNCLDNRKRNLLKVEKYGHIKFIDSNLKSAYVNFNGVMFHLGQYNNESEYEEAIEDFYNEIQEIYNE